MDELSLCGFGNMAGNFGALLAAVFSGWMVVRSHIKDDLQLIPRGDNFFILSNPGVSPIVVRKVFCKKGTLWYPIHSKAAYDYVFTDSKQKELGIDMFVHPLKPDILKVGVCMGGIQQPMLGKVRRVCLFQHTCVDILLIPEPLSTSPQETREPEK